MKTITIRSIIASGLFYSASINQRNQEMTINILVDEYGVHTYHLRNKNIQVVFMTHNINMCER